MSGAVVPQVGQVAMLNSILQKAGAVDDLTLKLYSNNRTPGLTDVAGDYDEVSGGGYASASLAAANFNVSSGNPSQALYNAFQTWTFTGATDSPGTVYGAFVVDANGVLVWAELFETGPVTPSNGTVIKYKPSLTQASANS